MRYQTLPASDNPLYTERELEQSHTSFYYEQQIFEQIKLGNQTEVKEKFDEYISSGFVMGKMSFNDKRQIKYWAVSGIAVAVHYAILGGADETDAFNMSDECIRFVDNENNEEKIFHFLGEKLLDLTLLVYQSKMQRVDSPVVRHAIHYIHLNLHHKITLEELALECKVSPNYLSALFKQKMGQTLMQYIKEQKIEAARLRLLEGAPVSKVAYEFGFCSESHFISNYKKHFGTTPYRSHLSAKA